MRKCLFIIVAICLGIFFSVAAMPMRVCLLDPEEQSENCCDTCPANGDDCCYYLEGIPDSQLPDGNFEAPAFVGYAIPPTKLDLPLLPERIVPPLFYARPPTGIGPPTARLAVLKVWRL